MISVTALTSAPAAIKYDAKLWRAWCGVTRGKAEHLLERGADINWIGYDDLTPLDTARRSGADELAEWLSARGGRSASEQP